MVLGVFSAMSEKKNKGVYRRIEGGHWYFRYKDLNGRFQQKCTGTSDYDEALLKKKTFIAKLRDPIVPYFRDELRRYQDINTNPKYRQAQIDGSNYSYRYAQRVTYFTKRIEKILLARCPEFLMLPLDEFTRRDAKKITEAIVLEVGHSRTAQMLQQTMKVIFSEARQDGVINLSPFEGQRVIRYNKKERYAVEENWIAWAVSRRDLFMDTQFWAYFTIAATTGMRRSEILALATEQLQGDILRIDRSLQGNNLDSPIGLPKWNIIRTIPVSTVTLEAIHSVTPDPEGRYFHKNSGWVYMGFNNLKATLNGVDPEHRDIWEPLTTHILRHSLNTDLIIAGIPEILVAEYLGWKHQGQMLDIQRRYTHVVTSHLRPIPEMVDRFNGRTRLNGSTERMTG